MGELVSHPRDGGEPLPQGRPARGARGGEEAGESIRDRIAREAGDFRYRAEKSTYWLRKNLGDPSQPTGYAAHHLVPKGAYSTRNPAARAQLEDAQARMTRLGIGPDEAANGVYLRPGTHKNTFGDDYFKALNERTKLIDEASPTAAKDAKRELARIGREIERGVFP